MSQYQTVNVTPETHRRLKALPGVIGENVANMVAKELCDHPLNQRVEITAIFREDGSALNKNEPEKNVTARGFHCRLCQRTIIPAVSYIAK